MRLTADQRYRYKSPSMVIQSGQLHLCKVTDTTELCHTHAMNKTWHIHTYYFHLWTQKTKSFAVWCMPVSCQAKKIFLQSQRRYFRCVKMAPTCSQSTCMDIKIAIHNTYISIYHQVLKNEKNPTSLPFSLIILSPPPLLHTQKGSS